MNGQPIAVGGWGKENSVFMPLKQIVDPGVRLNSYLDLIDTSDSAAPTRSTSKRSHLPDTFFAYNRDDLAWKSMQDIYNSRNDPHVNTRQGANGTYPEVSFTLVAQTVEGLLGVHPDALDGGVTTRSQLPSTIAWLQGDNIPAGANRVSVRQHGLTSSTLSNTAGPATVRRTATFAGSHRTVTAMESRFGQKCRL